MPFIYNANGVVIGVQDDVAAQPQPEWGAADVTGPAGGLQYTFADPAHEQANNQLLKALGKKATLKPMPKQADYDPSITTIAQRYDVGGERTIREAKQFIGGIEVEIEGCPEGKHKNFNIFVAKEDGSLRNSGIEFVSQPCPREQLVVNFKELHNWLKLDPKKDPFSHRTSIHVHVNVSSLTEKQAKNMLLLYALYEEFFFSMVKPERRANIHCVPLTETHLPAIYHKGLDVLRQRWSKYSALNLCRLGDLGTFEFRHHHGTDDVEALSIWLKVLDNLWCLSRQVVIDEASLSDELRLHAWFSTIFQPSPRTMMLSGQLMNIIGNNLIDVKFSTIKETPAVSKDA